MSRGIIKCSPMDPLGQLMAAGRPNLVLGHQMPASNALGQPSYTTVEEGANKKTEGLDVNIVLNPRLRKTHTIPYTYTIFHDTDTPGRCWKLNWFGHITWYINWPWKKCTNQNTSEAKWLLWLAVRTARSWSTPPHETAWRIRIATFNQMKPAVLLHRLWNIQ